MSNRLLQQILPTCLALQARRILDRKIQSDRKLLSEKTVNIRQIEDLDLLTENLKELYYDELRRRETIESKAGALFSINSIVIPLLVIAYNTTNNQNGSNTGIIIANILLAISVVYLTLSVTNAILAQKISATYKFTTQDLEIDTGKFQSITSIDLKRKSKIYYISTRLNVSTTAIKSNYVYAAQIDLRNGIVISIVALVLLIFS
ncbi:hypothetical protein LF599_05455 [Pseudodesulfovibrio thermohalotolerans]|uniref:hypothetical protein n=1 Tax=Pseudodesulfovibrio thermohalotolerans TaxID=2880651 RepID=UPI002441A517|nr:hypothetical protein [Pseudodesulfovibrio thermohalotolerans]WFS63611.1 hypothetical protein LF599_05455 [Pseudodesulfovibrio thermohalotolerans]